MDKNEYNLYFDGGSNPNPGPCAGAYVIYDGKGKEIYSGGKFIPNGTNNIGEYTGLIVGLERCISEGISNYKINVYGDSLLVISQIKGEWKVKNEGLKPNYQKTIKLIKECKHISFQHLKREFNKKADELSDKTLFLKDTWKN